LINAAATIGDLIWYASEERIFIWDSSKDLSQIKTVTSSHTQFVNHLHSNSHSMYSFGKDKIMARYSDDKEVAKTTLNAGAKAVSVDESLVVVLTFQDELAIFDAKDLQPKF